MASATRSTHGPASGPPPASKSPFEQQRAALVGEIATALENVLQNMNKLNRSLEGIIAVGDEFGSVEALWSQFEGVMAREGEGLGNQAEEEEVKGGGEEEETMRPDEKVR
ncbi:hypothetical protein MMC17_003539 [Xylographa soralifera]|nr:hypothetical protein [Xylographa soralifera]